LEESASGAVRTANFHDRQVGIVEHVDDVLAGRKFGIPCVELEGDGDFKVADDLRMSFAWTNRQYKE
jgi:hypothetical protein